MSDSRKKLSRSAVSLRYDSRVNKAPLVTAKGKGCIADKIIALAKENNIPFYVAAPTTTFDLETENGDKIPIEERSQDEVSSVYGYNNGKMIKVRIAPQESIAKNPAFDVTPARYITGIITEKGIIKANKEEIKKLFYNVSN